MNAHQFEHVHSQTPYDCLQCKYRSIQDVYGLDPVETGRASPKISCTIVKNVTFFLSIHLDLTTLRLC